jgi:threonine dehydrogenase-like Zn-dependent dehydrogenase
MLALVLEEGGIRLRQVDIPQPALGEALVKVRLAGVCRTDLELAKGYMGYRGILGHEFVGEVMEDYPSQRKEGQNLVGKRVVGEINCGCGQCELCRSGKQRHCPLRTVLGLKDRNGALAEYLTLPLENLHLVPDLVDDRAAVFTEPLAAALEIAVQMHLRPDTRALVIGDGKLGLLAARVLQILGCDLLALGSHQSKMAILRSWGIPAIPYREYQPDARDLVVDASGSPASFEIAMAALKPQGTLILKSTYQGTLTLDVAPLVINEITVVGSRCGPFAPALRLLAQNLVDTESLISAVYPASEMETAFAHAAQGEALKILVNFES